MDRPLRICYVIDNLAAAGTEKQLSRLLAGLDRAVVEPYLCLLDGSAESSRRLEPTDVSIIRLGIDRLASWGALKAAARFVHFLRWKRIDIVQAYFIDSALFAIPLARAAGIRSVLHVRNNAGYAHGLGLDRVDRICRYLTTLTITNSYVARCEWIKRGISAERIEVVANFLPGPAEHFHPPFQSAVPVVGIVANARPVKNLDGFLRMARSATEAGIDARFRIAGDGSERSSLQEMATKMGIANSVVFDGTVNDVFTFLAGVDIAVLCSHSESQSNAILEYLAAGKPILATDVGCNREWVEDSGAGIVAPAGDDAALVCGLLGMLGNREITCKMAIDGWNYYRTKRQSADPLYDWYRIYGITAGGCRDATAGKARSA